MLIICFEGTHGSGKTELCKLFQRAGFPVLDEAFLDLPEYALHPQSLTMETVWLANWFMRLLKMNHNLNDRERVFIADRSPYSSEYYASHGSLLGPIIKHQIEELRQNNIFVYTVLIKVDKELLWDRICKRLIREPGRAKYKEDSRDWMERTYAFYETHQWDFVINNDKSLPETMDALIQVLRENFPSDHHPGSPPRAFTEIHVSAV